MKIIQSSSHHCFVCGVDNPAGLKLTFLGDGEGTVKAQKRFTEDYQGYPGIVHGGVIAAVLDEAAGRATLKSKRPEKHLVTGKLSIRYRQPVRVGDLINIEGRVVSVSGKVYNCKSELRDEKGNLLADAEVIMVEPGQELIKAIGVGDDQWIDHEQEESGHDH